MMLSENEMLDIVATKSGGVKKTYEIVALNTTQLIAIDGSNEKINYFGKLIIAGTDSNTILANRVGGVDAKEFDNSEIIALGNGHTGTFTVFFNKVSSMNAVVGSHSFIGYKVTNV